MATDITAFHFDMFSVVLLVCRCSLVLELSAQFVLSAEVQASVVRRRPSLFCLCDESVYLKENNARMKHDSVLSFMFFIPLLIPCVSSDWYVVTRYNYDYRLWHVRLRSSERNVQKFY